MHKYKECTSQNCQTAQFKSKQHVQLKVQIAKQSPNSNFLPKSCQKDVKVQKAIKMLSICSKAVKRRCGKITRGIKSGRSTKYTEKDQCASNFSIHHFPRPLLFQRIISKQYLICLKSGERERERERERRGKEKGLTGFRLEGRERI